MAKQGNENVHLVNDFRAEKANGRIVKRFQDEYFALDLLRTLYDDTVGASAKAELLIALEEYGHLGITTESVDQIITSLLDIFQQAVDKADSSQMVCQILITCTSLIIQLDQLEAHICRSVVNELITIVTSRVNQPGSERLRSCACQSLIHLEDFCQGVLLPYYDDLTELYKRERTYVFQDYSLLTAKLMEALGSPYGGRPNAAKFTEGRFMQKQVSHEPHELRKTVADLVENVPLFTRSGSFRITQSLSTLVKQLPDISPMIFKPLMLHQMSTMSCIVFHTVLYVQHEFGGEILTGPEEADMLHRLCKMTSHPCLNQLHRLLATHWVHWYKQNVAGQAEIHESIVRKQRIIFYPSVFDSVDCQLAKLSITSLCGDTSNDTNGLETSILLGSLGCLHKMVWHTGSSQAARALFRALYFIYTRHNNESFSQDIQRFVRGLISEFAHFIPHSIDFVDSIHSLNINSNVYVETLSLLHQQVVMATEEQIHMSYPFYLLIMKKVAAQSEINQNCTLKFLDYLAQHATDIDDSSWRLGHGILDICRNIIICQGTHNYYTVYELYGQPSYMLHDNAQSHKADFVKILNFLELEKAEHFTQLTILP